MRTVTVTSLISQVRQRADIENETDRFGDTELIGYINSSWAELYNEIVLLNNDVYLSSYNISISTGLDTYSLPSDYYLDRGVDFTFAGYTYSLSRWSFEEREIYQFVGTYTYGMPTAYRILGQNIVFKPVPANTGVAATLWYYPAPATLGSGSVVDGIAGFEEFLVADVAMKVMAKDDRDPGQLPAMKANALRVLKHAMAGPSRAVPDRIIRRYSRPDLPRRPYPR